jgi:hypothetical protein
MARPRSILVGRSRHVREDRARKGGDGGLCPSAATSSSSSRPLARTRRPPTNTSCERRSAGCSTTPPNWPATTNRQPRRSRTRSHGRRDPLRAPGMEQRDGALRPGCLAPPACRDSRPAAPLIGQGGSDRRRRPARMSRAGRRRSCGHEAVRGGVTRGADSRTSALCAGRRIDVRLTLLRSYNGGSSETSTALSPTLAIVAPRSKSWR